VTKTQWLHIAGTQQTWFPPVFNKDGGWGGGGN
jgi:hypothetical protein